MYSIARLCLKMIKSKPLLAIFIEILTKWTNLLWVGPKWPKSYAELEFTKAILYKCNYFSNHPTDSHQIKTEILVLMYSIASLCLTIIKSKPWLALFISILTKLTSLLWVGPKWPAMLEFTQILILWFSCLWSLDQFAPSRFSCTCWGQCILLLVYLLKPMNGIFYLLWSLTFITGQNWSM